MLVLLVMLSLLETAVLQIMHNTSLTLSPRRLRCPMWFPCMCRSVRIYRNQAVVENRVDCRAIQMSEVPDLTPLRGHRISKLLLARNNIQHISPSDFLSITILNANILSDFPVLDLSYNPLGALDPHVFDNVTTHELALILDQCGLAALPLLPASFTPHLSCLYIRNNDISHIPHAFFDSYTHLRVLDLSGNLHLHLQPDSLQGLSKSLQFLYLENMGLTQVPNDTVVQFEDLRFLSFAKNQITYLPDFMLDGLNVTEIILRISENKINNISPNAFRIRDSTKTSYSINRLYLDYNMMTDLDFLLNPCEMADITLVAVRGNPILCECGVYNITRYKVTGIWGECYWQPHGDNDTYVSSVDLHLAFEAPQYCNLPPTDFLYDCNCREWRHTAERRRGCSHTVAASSHTSAAAAITPASIIFTITLLCSLSITSSQSGYL